MKSPLLALFVRALRQDGRSGATYWARGGLGLFLQVVLLIAWLSSRWFAAPGKGVFSAIITFQLMAITFVGLSYFASAIAEEKEEQTLGLLRMTGLNPLAILLGKSTSRLCGALLFLTGQLPFTIFAVTLGGISLHQIFTAYCTLVAFTFLLCNLALLGSVIAKRTGGAVGFCFAVAILVALFGWILRGVEEILIAAGHPWHLDKVADLIAAASPVGRLAEVLSTGFRGFPIGTQVIVDVVLGVVCFLLAWLLFERMSDRAPDVVFAVARMLPSGSGRYRRFFLGWSQPPRAWRKAILWKDFYFLHGGRIAFGLRVLVYGGIAGLNLWDFLKGGSPTSSMGTGTGSGSIIPLIFAIDIAVMSGRIFRVELNEQTFGALIGLPGTLAQLAQRKLLACLLAAAPGIVACVVDQASFLVFSHDPSSRIAGDPLHLWAAIGVLSAWASTALLVSMVVWLSLRMKRGAAPLGCLLTSTLSLLLMFICGLMSMAVIAGLAATYPSLRVLSSQVMPSAITGLLSAILAGVVYVATLVKLEALTQEN